MLKQCSRCRQEKPATSEFFGPHKMGRNGFEPACRGCKRQMSRELRARPDQRIRQQAWRDANKRRVREYNIAYRAAGYSSTLHVADWREKNLESARAYARLAQKRRMQDPAYRLKGRISARLHSMKCGKAGRKTEEILGYTRNELQRHLERQFTKGMSWDHVMAGRIEIDHIVPVSAFEIAEIGDAEFRACWSLGNLRPLWARDNRSKNRKVLTLL